MIGLTLAEIAAAVGGEVDGPPGSAETVVSAPAFVDSRLVESGGLFVAIAGEHVDGHEYAEKAFAGGAAAVLGSRATGVPMVIAEDTVAALGRLTRYVADRLTGTTVLAITGSQGKTGTKDYLAQVLAAAGPTVATAGNFNNEIGVPLTVLRAKTETRYLVVEMGARGIGHLSYLCELVPPDVSVVINVGTAHLGEFGSREAIALAKGELVEALTVDGVAVINADDPMTAAMAARTRGRVSTFGGTPDATVSWRDATLDDLGRPRFTLVHDGQTAEVALRLVGEHQVPNAAAAAAAALAAGLPLDDVAASLSTATATSRWRMEIHELRDDVVLINDSYNANPTSMKAAIEALRVVGERRGTRTVAVLGEMKELGADSDAEHAGVGRAAAAAGVDHLLVVGPPAVPIADGAAAEPDWQGVATRVETRDEALAWLRKNVAAGDVVLVKASRAAALETVAAGLVEERST
ncbi:UDP-N-acetylmuramoyl-tripeptide--D-alanyl-D-alanine ligase [Nocardioides speluncae]|uniref:UDP-N-acetylmuramoyl-tripeptide--D-alanyl-D- alanine ligase n=1 Tax=Nocardioides speluncae TaxID=2670337 RepID=UPI000D69A09E|nr:UDP-N-acetylmuramoyl-tripeptide--D-alanyl-D-alanine ligase [Nocardioides speluncae]